MTDNLIARSDAPFDLTQKQFVSSVSGAPDKVGLLAADVAGLKTAQTAWETSYQAHIKAHQDALAATQAKRAARRHLEELIRLAARKLNGHPSTNNAVRTLVGLPPRDRARTAQNAPVSRPLARLEPIAQATLLIHCRDELTPDRVAKPKGARGFEVWVTVGDVIPTDESAYRFLALATRTPYTHVHDAASTGKTAFYLLRWQSPRGEPGPFSTMAMAKIPL